MVDTKISELTEDTAPQDDDELVTVDTSAGASKRVALAAIVRYEVDTVVVTGSFTARARQMVILNHASTPIALTISGAPVVGDELEIIAEDNGGSSHTCVLSGSVTFDGTNQTATFDATAERLRMIAESITRWRIVANTGGVVLSA